MTRARILLLSAIAAASVVGPLAACTTSPGGSGSGCPTLFNDCPDATPPPSWQNDVQPLIATYCLRCHSDGGVAPPQFNYTTYQGVFRSRAVMVTELNQCFMPPGDASPPAAMPTPAERQTLVSWIACGAPQN
jgi:hypothetical protein